MPWCWFRQEASGYVQTLTHISTHISTCMLPIFLSLPLLFTNTHTSKQTNKHTHTHTHTTHNTLTNTNIPTNTNTQNTHTHTVQCGAVYPRSPQYFSQFHFLTMIGCSGSGEFMYNCKLNMSSLTILHLLLSSVSDANRL